MPVEFYKVKTSWLFCFQIQIWNRQTLKVSNGRISVSIFLHCDTSTGLQTLKRFALGNAFGDRFWKDTVMSKNSCHESPVQSKKKTISSSCSTISWEKRPFQNMLNTSFDIHRIVVKALANQREHLMGMSYRPPPAFFFLGTELHAPQHTFPKLMTDVWVWMWLKRVPILRKSRFMPDLLCVKVAGQLGRSWSLQSQADSGFTHIRNRIKTLGSALPNCRAGPYSRDWSAGRSFRIFSQRNVVEGQNLDLSLSVCWRTGLSKNIQAFCRLCRCFFSRTSPWNQWFSPAESKVVYLRCFLKPCVPTVPQIFFQSHGFHVVVNSAESGTSLPARNPRN